MSLEKYYPQGDYDEGSQFSLNEAGWHSYLSAVDVEAGKFLRLFILIMILLVIAKYIQRKYSIDAAGGTL